MEPAAGPGGPCPGKNLTIARLVGEIVRFLSTERTPPDLRGQHVDRAVLHGGATREGDAIRATIASGDADAIELLKDVLDEFNNLTAPGFCD